MRIAPRDSIGTPKNSLIEGHATPRTPSIRPRPTKPRKASSTSVTTPRELGLFDMEFVSACQLRWIPLKKCFRAVSLLWVNKSQGTQHERSDGLYHSVPMGRHFHCVVCLGRRHLQTAFSARKDSS